jgi:hypothetical protein
MAYLLTCGRPVGRFAAAEFYSFYVLMSRYLNVLELAVVNPVGVFGPVLGPDYSTSKRTSARGAIVGLPAMYQMSPIFTGLPWKRVLRSGHILGVSSGQGITALPLIGFYSATKWAVATGVLALAVKKS